MIIYMSQRSHPSSNSQQIPFHYGGYNPIVEVIDLITPYHSPAGVGSVHSPIPELIDLVTPEHSVTSSKHHLPSTNTIDLTSSTTSRRRKGRPPTRPIKYPINDDNDSISSLSSNSQSGKLVYKKRRGI